MVQIRIQLKLFGLHFGANPLIDLADTILQTNTMFPAIFVKLCYIHQFSGGTIRLGMVEYHITRIAYNTGYKAGQISDANIIPHTNIDRAGFIIMIH